MDRRTSHRSALRASSAPLARATGEDRDIVVAPEPHEAQLDVRLLGTFDARWCGTPLTGVLSSRRTRSLVQHLIVARGAAVARDELAFELWPDVPDGQARANLRQALVRAVRALPGGHAFIVATSGSLAWNVAAPAVIDLLRFDACLSDASRARSDGDEARCLAALREAVSLYRGDLGVDVAGGRMERARAGLHEDVLRALHELVALHLTAQRANEAIACCERVLELDPLDEPSYLRLMRLYETVGAPRKGLHVYERLRAILHDEVASPPSAAAAALATRLGERVEHLDRAVPPASDHDLGRVRAVARRARTEGTQVIVVRGHGARAVAAGLLEQDAKAHEAFAATVLGARASGEEARVPFATAARLLGTRRLALAAARVGAPWSTELRRLAGARAYTSPPSRAAEDATQMGLVFDALSATLQFEHDGVHLVIEQAEGIDPASALWLGSLLDHTGTGPVVVVALGQRDDVVQGPVHRLIGDARARQRCIEVDLGASAQAGDPRVLAARLNDLTEPARRALEALAVLGMEAPTETLRRVVARPRDTVAAALAELARRGFVEPSGDGRSVVLPSPAVRDAVLASTPSASRTLLHGQAADALRGGPRGLARHDAIVADHLERSGRIPEAATAWTEAARRAASVAALDVAIDAYERAIALAAEAVFGAASPVLVTLWRELGDVHARRLDGVRARDAYDEAARHAGQEGVALAELAWRRAETHVSERTFGDALAELDLATTALRSGARHTRRAWRTAIDVDVLRARVLYFLPEGVDADGTTSQALLARLERAVARHGTLAQRFEVDQAVLGFQIREERYRLSPATRVRAERAVRTALATGDAGAIADARFGLGFVTLFGGDPERAMTLLEEARHHAERSGVRLLLVQSVAYLGVASRLAGRVEHLEAAQRELEALVSGSTPLYLGLAHAQRSYLAALTGDVVGARRAVDAALAAWGERWYPFRWTALCTLLAVAASDAAARAAAAAMLAPAQQRLPPELERALQRFARARTSLPTRREEALAAARAAGWS